MSQIAELADSHLVKATAAIASLPPKLRPAFAIVALIEHQLAQWKANPRSPFIPPRDHADWKKIARLTWWSLRQL
jgi:phytoene synthase